MWCRPLAAVCSRLCAMKVQRMQQTEHLLRPSAFEGRLYVLAWGTAAVVPDTTFWSVACPGVLPCLRAPCPAAQLRLSAFNTPYGDAQLDPVGIEHDVRRKLVWAELEHRMKRGLPVQVRTPNGPQPGSGACIVWRFMGLMQSSAHTVSHPASCAWEPQSVLACGA